MGEIVVAHAPADQEALKELLLRVSRLADEVPEIVELDLNPVIAAGAALIAVDVLVIVEDSPRGTEGTT